MSFILFERHEAIIQFFVVLLRCSKFHEFPGYRIDQRAPLGGLMLAVLVRRLPRVAVREPLGFPVNASGVVAEVTNIACDAARCGAGARRAFSAAAARVGAKSRQLDQRALLSPFRRHLSVSPQTAAWKKTPDGFVRVGEHVKTNTTRSSSASRPASRGTQKTTRIVTATSVQRDDSAMGKSNAPTSNTNNSKPTHQKQKGYQTKGVGSRAFIQVLGLGVDVNDTSPSVLLFTDTERILFNVGEGFQRFSVEHQINIRCVFFPVKSCSAFNACFVYILTAFSMDPVRIPHHPYVRDSSPSRQEYRSTKETTNHFLTVPHTQETEPDMLDPSKLTHHGWAHRYAPHHGGRRH